MKARRSPVQAGPVIGKHRLHLIPEKRLVIIDECAIHLSGVNFAFLLLLLRQAEQHAVTSFDELETRLLVSSLDSRRRARRRVYRRIYELKQTFAPFFEIANVLHQGYIILDHPDALANEPQEKT